MVKLPWDLFHPWLAFRQNMKRKKNSLFTLEAIHHNSLFFPRRKTFLLSKGLIHLIYDCINVRPLLRYTPTRVVASLSLSLSLSLVLSLSLAPPWSERVNIAAERFSPLKAKRESHAHARGAVRPTQRFSDCKAAQWPDAVTWLFKKKMRRDLGGAVAMSQRRFWTNFCLFVENKKGMVVSGL